MLSDERWGLKHPNPGLSAARNCILTPPDCSHRQCNTLVSPWKAQGQIGQCSKCKSSPPSVLSVLSLTSVLPVAQVHNGRSMGVQVFAATKAPVAVTGGCPAETNKRTQWPADAKHSRGRGDVHPHASSTLHCPPATRTH